MKLLSFKRFLMLKESVFQKLKMCTEDVFSMIEYEDNYIDLYPSYSDDYINEFADSYYFQTKEEAYEKVNNVLNFFNSFADRDYIEIYRNI